MPGRPINPIRDAKMAEAYDRGDIEEAKRIFEEYAAKKDDGWHRVAGSPGPGDTAVLVNGPGFDFNGLIGVTGDGNVFLRRRDDEDAQVQHVPVADLLWLLKEHGHIT